MNGKILLLSAFFIPSTAFAVDLSLSKASPIAPVPIGTVMRVEMAPPEGMPSIAARKRPAYEVTDYKQVGGSAAIIRFVPLPEFNMAKVSFCQADTF